MIDGVNGDVEDMGDGWAWGWGQREEGLALAAEADVGGRFRAADTFAEYGIFDKDAKAREVDKAVEGGARGSIGVVNDVGGERKEGIVRGFDVFGFSRAREEVVAK